MKEMADLKNENHSYRVEQQKVNKHLLTRVATLEQLREGAKDVAVVNNGKATDLLLCHFK